MNEVYIPNNHHYYEVLSDFEYQCFESYLNKKLIASQLKIIWYKIDWNNLPLQFDNNGKPYYNFVIPARTILEFRCNSSSRIGWRVYKKYNKDSTLQLLGLVHNTLI